MLACCKDCNPFALKSFKQATTPAKIIYVAGLGIIIAIGQKLTLDILWILTAE